MTKRLLFVFAIAVGAAPVLQAQSIPSADTLTVQRALELVANAHPSTAAAELRAEARAAALSGITSWSAPTLSYAMEGLGTSGGFAEQRIVGGIERAPIAIARAQSARLRAERLALLSDADVVRRSLRFRVVAAFVDLAAADSLVALRHLGVELADGLVRVAQLRERAGETAGIETLRAELERENAVAALAEATAQRRAASATAVASVGLATTSGTALAPVLTLPVGIAESLGAQDSPRLPELEAAANRVDAAVSRADEVRAERLPTLTGEVFPQHFGGRSLGLGFLVGVRIPLFQGAAYDARDNAALIEIRASEAELEAVRTSLEVDASAARERVTSNIQALAALEAGPIPQAEELLALSTRGYELGEVTQAAMLDTLRIQLDIRERALRALHAVLASVADFEHATGQSVLFAN